MGQRQSGYYKYQAIIIDKKCGTEWTLAGSVKCSSISMCDVNYIHHSFDNNYSNGKTEAILRKLVDYHSSCSNGKISRGRTYEWKKLCYWHTC